MVKALNNRPARVPGRAVAQLQDLEHAEIAENTAPLKEPPPDVVKVEDLSIPVDGTAISVRVYHHSLMDRPRRWLPSARPGTR
jgi:hypothetical protein